MPDTKTTVEMGLLFFEYRYDSDYSYDYVFRDEGEVAIYTFIDGQKHMITFEDKRLTPLSVAEKIIELEYHIEEDNGEAAEEVEEMNRLYS